LILLKKYYIIYIVNERRKEIKYELAH